jgi:hypothetical protein
MPLIWWVCGQCGWLVHVACGGEGGEGRGACGDVGDGGGGGGGI